MEVDFSDINDIEGSASLILSMADNAFPASLIPGASGSATPAKAAREWVKEVTRHIGAMPAGNAMRATGCLDLMHRLAYGSPADGALIDAYRLAAFDSFVRGDSSVDRYMLFNVVSTEVNRRNRKFLGKPLQWESLCIDRWHRQFRHGVSIDGLSDHDTICRVTALLGSDLWAFETKNEGRYKRLLFENHRHYLDAMSDADTIQNTHNIKHNTEEYSLLIANSSLLTASAPYLTSGEYSRYDSRIRNALIASPSTNRFHREALRLSITD